MAQDVCVKLGERRPLLSEAAPSFPLGSTVSPTTPRIDRIVSGDSNCGKAKGRDVVVLVPGSGPLSRPKPPWSRRETSGTRCGGLPPQQRDAVIFVYAEDLTHAEAAGRSWAAPKKRCPGTCTRHGNACEHGSMAVG